MTNKKRAWCLTILSTWLWLTGCSSLAWTDFALAGVEGADDQRMTTLTIELFDRNNTPADYPPITDNFMTQYIQEHFGEPHHIQVEFVTVPRFEEFDKLNVLMKANQAPDIVFTYDEQVVAHYVNQGMLTDLTDLLAEHGQDLQAVLGEDVLRYGIFDGKQYAIPARRILTAQSTTFIREDWLEELGLPLPETTDEFYHALKAFKEHKQVSSGEAIVPYGMLDYYHTEAIRYSFWDWDTITEEDRYAVPSWMMPGNKEAYRFLNKLYHEGLVDPNFMLLMDRESLQFQHDLINGKIGAATTNTNEPVYMGYLAELQKQDPRARLTPIDPFTTPDGSTPKAILPQNGMYIMVPKTSQNAEVAIQYLNWMAQPEHYMTLQNGIEGQTYEMIDGVPVMMDTEQAKQMLYNYFDYCIILNGKYVGTTDPVLNMKANAFHPKYEAFTQQSIAYGMKDGIPEIEVDAVIHAEIKYSKLLSDKDNEMFVKIITADPKQFDEVYDKEAEDYMRMGGEQVMNAKRQAYRAQMR